MSILFMQSIQYQSRGRGDNGRGSRTIGARGQGKAEEIAEGDWRRDLKWRGRGLEGEGGTREIMTGRRFTASLSGHMHIVHVSFLKYVP